MSELLPLILWEDCFLGVFENYVARLILLEPEFGLGSTPPDKILPLKISHPVGNFHAHISSDCTDPCDLLQPSMDRVS